MLRAMPSTGRPAEKLDVPWSFRISSQDRKEVEYAGKRLRTNDQSAYRFAAKIGLRLLREIDYAVEEAVVEQAISVAIKKAGTRNHL